MEILTLSSRIRLEQFVLSHLFFHNDGYAKLGEIDGERVTVWSGVSRQNSSSLSSAQPAQSSFGGK
jgi:hypothetical protein